jgi:hypothetical protein
MVEGGDIRLGHRAAPARVLIRGLMNLIRTTLHLDRLERATMDKVVDIAPALAVIVVAIGLVGYAVALVLAAFLPQALDGRGKKLADWILAAPSLRTLRRIAATILP